MRMKRTTKSIKREKEQGKMCCSSEGAIQLPHGENADELAGLAWAIAHPVRVRIVQLLLSRKSCVCGEIVEEFSLAQSTISQHLKILKESQLVQGEIDGPRICYCINPGKLKQLKRLVSTLTHQP